MALKHLELSEMVGLSAPWVGAKRALIEAIPQVSGWLPQLQEVHARVVKVQPVSTASLEAEVAEIAAEEARIDNRHDDLIRVTSQMLDTERLLCRASEPARLERAGQCERALSALLPRGLVVVNTLYVAEAGYASRTRDLLASDPELSALLASIPTSSGGTLLSVVEAWCALGEQLGKLEEKKANVQARIASIPQPPRAEMLAARNAWLSIVNAILTNLELVEGHQEAIEALRGPVLRTAEIAGKRYEPSGAAGTPAKPAPATPATPAAPAAPAAPAGAPIEPGMPGAKPFS